MLSKEQLMKPRYKVIGLWPGAETKIDDILAGWYSKSGNTIHGPELFPHLLKPLQWWEERKPEDMPEYVIDNTGDCWKWADHDFSDEFLIYNQIVPATLEEYQSYTNSK